MGVSGALVGDGLQVGQPVPGAGVGLRLQAVASDVEPHGRVEGHHLVNEDVNELVVEGGGVVGGTEVSGVHAPVTDGFGDAGDQRAHARLTVGAHASVKIFAGNNVGGRHGPVFGSLDVFLAEDVVTLGVGDGGGARFPFDGGIGIDASLGEVAAE